MTRKPLPIALFGAAALLPAALLLAGVAWGGFWVWLGFLYMAGFVIVLDQLLPFVAGNAAEGAEFPGDDALLVAVGVTHGLLLPGLVWAVAGPSGLAVPDRLALAIGGGSWIGQVAHPAAHELIHRGNRHLYRIGVGIYVSILIGHHASAHRLVHHRHVATADDPSSAPAGMGFWSYAPRAWIGSFRAGLRAETALRTGRQVARLHPYAVYAVGSALCLAGAYLLGGAAAMLVWIGVALHAQLQLLLADYVQHYGLRRKLGPDGRAEPVTERHSWNSPHWVSSAMMLNAPRHSDHHAHPSRAYPNLRLPDTGPVLPWPLPLAGAIAMFPRIWKRRMKPLLQEWSD